MKVTLQSIGKKYESNEEFTLRDIDLEIEDQEFCVILGPSGCGKTTLLRMIAGLNSITEGDLYFGEKRMNAVASKDRDIAMVFQSYALYPHMTVYENMAFSLMMRKERKKLIQERVIEAAEMLQIKDHLYAKPSEISGGQRQRVALGRSIVKNPQVFLMDEPLSNLDAKLREQMRVELIKLHQTLGTTTIYVTHDQVEAMTMASKIILMDEGKIQQIGKPEEFHQRPANMFVAQFIGSPTMNLINGKITDKRFIADNGMIGVTLSKEDQKVLTNYEDRQVAVGVRPERFLRSDESNETFECTIEVVEMLGKEKILYALLDDGSYLTISTPGHYQYQANERYSFGLDRNALHIFDLDTGNRIN